MIKLLSKTGLGRSGHVRFPTFGPISHVSGPKTKFLTKFINDSAWLLPEKLKNHVILTKSLIIFDQKSHKYPKKFGRY